MSAYVAMIFSSSLSGWGHGHDGGCPSSCMGMGMHEKDEFKVKSGVKEDKRAKRNLGFSPGGLHYYNWECLFLLYFYLYYVWMCFHCVGYFRGLPTCPTGRPPLPSPPHLPPPKPPATTHNLGCPPNLWKFVFTTSNLEKVIQNIGLRFIQDLKFQNRP